MFLLLWGKYLRVELLGHCTDTVWLFKKLLNGFPKCMRITVFPYPCWHLVLSDFFQYSHRCIGIFRFFPKLRWILKLLSMEPPWDMLMKLYAKIYAHLHFHENRIYTFQLLKAAPHSLKCSQLYKEQFLKMWFFWSVW